MHAPDDAGAGVLTVPAGDAERVIRMLKLHLTGERECGECGYTAAVSRWGYRTHELADTDRVALTACCPACESVVRLRRESAVPDSVE